MDLTANSVSIIEKTKTSFEERMKANVANDIFKTVVTRAIPLKDGEYDRINNPEFREKLSNVLSDVSKNMVQEFNDVAQFDTGNLFTSMVTSVSDSVALEADYRMNKLIQKIRLGKINQSDTVAFNTAVHDAFDNVKAFESAEIFSQMKKNMEYLYSREDANDVIERIKNDVKDAIDETQAKNDLVEGTTQEIIDYKEEIAPPDDQYEDPENPTTDPEGDPTADPEGNGDDAGGEDPITDTSDDGLAGDDGGDEDLPEGSGDQVYEDDGTGTEETSTGEEPAEGIGGEEPGDDLGGGDDPTGESDLGTDENLAGEGDLGDDTDGGADLGDDPAAGEGDDLGGDSELGDDTVADPAPAEQTGNGTTVADGNNNSNSGGITININGADLAKAKESLNLLSARSLSEKRIPITPREFNNMKLPTVETLSAECVNAGLMNLDKEIKIRMDMLKLSTKQANGSISQESMNTINDKINVYGAIIADSISNASKYTKTMENMGITAQGLVFSNENQLCIARNIINRFLTKTQFVSPVVRPYNSKENVFANAFDIVQLRKYVNSHENVKSVVVDDLFARENLFYHNMINYNDEEVKKQAYSIIDLSLMNFQKAMSPNFITDYKIKAWEMNVGEKSNKEVNDEVVKRTKEKFEKLWMRDLNDDEMKIIRGAANQEDVTELTPTPYEKFMITMTKESILAHGSEDPSVGARLSKEEKKDIEWKSRLMTTVYKTAEAFGFFKFDDEKSFNKFTNMVGM